MAELQVLPTLWFRNDWADTPADQSRVTQPAWVERLSRPVPMTPFSSGFALKTRRATDQPAGNERGAV